MQDVVQALTRLLQDGTLVGFASIPADAAGEQDVSQVGKVSVSKLGATRSGMMKQPIVPPPTNRKA